MHSFCKQQVPYHFYSLSSSINKLHCTCPSHSFCSSSTVQDNTHRTHAYSTPFNSLYPTVMHDILATPDNATHSTFNTIGPVKHDILVTPDNETHCTFKTNAHVFNEVSVVLLWHHILGHVLFIKMKGISSFPAHFLARQPFTYTICPMAKQTRLLFPNKTTSTTSTFELIDVDLWRPYHVAT